VTGVLIRARELGITLEADGNAIVARPKGTTPPELAEAIRAHKPELLTTLIRSKESNPAETADEALAVLQRLKGFVLPDGRIPIARELAKRLYGLTDARAIFSALRAFECELAALGGRYDPELAAGVAMVETTFPGARLIKVTQVRPLNTDRVSRRRFNAVW
jgi:tubulysin polyketide synthase-like protein